MKTRLNLPSVAAIVGLVSAAQAAPSLAPDTNAAPKQFTARINTFRKISYSVELRDGVILYSERSRGQPTEIRITPTDAQWREFRLALDKLQIWQWRELYENPSLSDGTTWLLSLQYSDQQIRVSGRNAYPGADGKVEASSTETFKTYLAAVRKLLNGKDFK